MARSQPDPTLPPGISWRHGRLRTVWRGRYLGTFDTVEEAVNAQVTTAALQEAEPMGVDAIAAKLGWSRSEVERELASATLKILHGVFGEEETV